MVVWRFVLQLFYRCVFYLQTAVKKNTVNNDSGLGRRLEKIKTNHARRRRGFRKDTGCVGVVKRVFPGESGSHLTFTRRATPPRAVVWPTYQDRPSERLSPSPSPRSIVDRLKTRVPLLFARFNRYYSTTRPPASQPAHLTGKFPPTIFIVINIIIFYLVPLSFIPTGPNCPRLDGGISAWAHR